MTKFLLLTASVLFLAVGMSSADILPPMLKPYDVNSDDIIDEEERQAIRDLRVDLKKEGLKSIDTDGDGKISPAEKRSAQSTLRLKLHLRRKNQFAKVAGEDHLISPSEYALIPGVEKLPAHVFEGIFKRLDTNQDGFISEGEFLSRLRPQVRPA